MKSTVLVVGEGQLADFVHQELSNKYQVFRQPDFKTGVSETADLALVLHDAWKPSIHREAEGALQPMGTPWLRGFVSFGHGIVGPLVRPGISGCSQCANMRQLMAGLDRQEMWELQLKIAEQEDMLPRDAWASRTGLLQVAYLLLAEVQRVLEGSQAHTQGHLFLINMKSLQTSRHFFLPNPKCPVCGRLPEDSATSAQITLQPSLKISADSYRCRPMNELNTVLVNDYLDFQIGFFNGKMRDLVSPFAAASVNLPLVNGDEGTAGRTHSYEESELTAILEGLERYCGIEPRGKRKVIHDTYRNLADHALNPVTVGVHAKEEYAKPGFPFKPFDPDHPMDWVWGYSFLQERPILVPELLAYYSLGHGNGFVYETSNGCALGGSLEEAIFYGIMEVVERDSFLLTWYAQLPIPQIDLHSIKDQEIQLMIGRLQAVAGYDVHLFNSTMEHGIPSVWAMAKNQKQKGVNLNCAAGAHLDPIRAVKGAIHELSGLLLTLDEKFEANQEEYVRMFHDSSLVRGMEDHSMLYSLPQAEERLQFLLAENRPKRTFDEEFKKRDWQEDLTEDLRNIIEGFRRLNLDVIVVNQTTPEIIRNGLHCVKVLIPGMLPMTFGHHLTRVNGLTRVLRVPVELGYAKQPLTLDQLNPYPHPFP
jgi:ribosomal protein S12 methylthiotransferase accessory factor